METMTLNFTTRARYARAVRRLMTCAGYRMTCHGKYMYDDNYYGYVEFIKLA